MTNLSNIVEILAKQALGSNSNQHQSQQSGGLGGILGSVLGQLGNNHQQGVQSQQGGLGGILGSVLGQFGGSSQGLGGSSKTSLLVAVLPLVLAWIQKQGGLQGALDKLKGQGLSSQVDDWVSTGPGENASVNPQEVQNLFDDEEVEQVAQQTHAPKQDIYGAISQVLPQIIDSLTPQGEQTSKTEANNDIQNVLNMVSGFLKR
ncbi:YidB family protein [Acinetobacter indicus]|uniref:YidB family protein n=1 Tax=Acinetobacter indicus TaxID=756892 RepID=UPI0014443946|nr:YidB family protein [Acinetobacter indicus]